VRLGVLLYELLTGTTHFDKNRLAQVAYDELIRIFREEEPPKPSTRLSRSTESLPVIAAQRKTEPARLSRMFRGDLDWITMKALEKDRTRRYETDWRATSKTVEFPGMRRRPLKHAATRPVVSPRPNRNESHATAQSGRTGGPSPQSVANTAWQDGAAPCRTRLIGFRQMREMQNATTGNAPRRLHGAAKTQKNISPQYFP
jgi:hypothetical protein